MLARFNNTEEASNLHKWMQAKIEIEAAYWYVIYNEPRFTEDHAAYVYDNQLFDFALFYNRGYWIANYRAIIEAFYRAGTFEAYIFVIRSALGATTAITFETKDEDGALHEGHLRINITPATSLQAWGLSGENTLLQLETGEDYAFNFPASEQTISQVTAMLKAIMVDGVFLEVIFL